MLMKSSLKSQLNSITSYGIEFIGKIRDSLHDTVPYTAYEKIIFDRQEFQRLRRIHQTAFTQYVFPGATHTRFEHSLGAMHIAGLMYYSLIANQRRILSSLSHAFQAAPIPFKNSFMDYELKNGSLLQTQDKLEYLEDSAYLIQCLRFAALLHDCGHAPLSHSGERFMPSWENLEENLDKLEIPLWLKEPIRAKLVNNKKNSKSPIHHEIYTLLIVQHLFQYNDEFLSEKMGQDICAILDISITPSHMGDLFKSGMQSLFHEIVSGEIDADRMDYLLRDSHECGVVYGHFDLGRILDSLGFYFNPSTNQCHLAIRRSGISAYEDYLRARQSMYNQVYFHKTATACEAMLEHFKKKLPSFCFPLDIKAYTNLDEYNVLDFINKNIPNSHGSYLSIFIKELLYERKIWKRVYEEILPFNSRNNPSLICNKILEFLEKNNIPSEIIENSTNLTRFSPKRNGEISKNNFKAIVKNVDSLSFLEPIENHSTLINRIDEDFVVRRIFIPKFDHNFEEININSIQKIISEKIINSNQGV